MKLLKSAVVNGMPLEINTDDINRLNDGLIRNDSITKIFEYVFSSTGKGPGNIDPKYRNLDWPNDFNSQLSRNPEKWITETKGGYVFRHEYIDVWKEHKELMIELVMDEVTEVAEFRDGVTTTAMYHSDMLIAVKVSNTEKSLTYINYRNEDNFINKSVNNFLIYIDTQKIDEVVRTELSHFLKFDLPKLVKSKSGFTIGEVNLFVNRDDEEITFDYQYGDASGWHNYECGDGDYYD